MEVGNLIKRGNKRAGFGVVGLGSCKSRSDAAFGRRRLESQSPSVASSASRAKNHL